MVKGNACNYILHYRPNYYYNNNNNNNNHKQFLTPLLTSPKRQSKTQYQSVIGDKEHGMF